MADKKDFYDVLGVPKGATDDEIKKAYRSGAKKYHPDLNPGDAAAEAKFKEINEAYEVLSDSEKKARYDQYGHAGVDPNYGAGQGGYNPFSGGGFGDFGDIFESFFGGFGGGQQTRRSANAPQKGSDLQMNLMLSFEEAAKGCRKTVEFSRVETCDRCGGSGADTGSSAKTCPDCGGSGQVRVTQQTPFGVVQSSKVCPKCSGKGKIIEKPCPKCNAQGRVRKNTTLEVDIPAGVDNGSIVTLRGQGNAGANGGQSGNFQVVIAVRPHPFFERDGNDIWYEQNLNIIEASLGTEVEVPTLDGKIKLKVPEGAQYGDVHRIKDKGIPDVHGRGKGHLYVRIIVEVPQKLSERQKEILREFGETIGVSEEKPGAKGKKKKFGK